MNTQDIQEKFFREGKLIVIPKKLKSKQVLFAYLQEELAKKGSTFTEKEVNGNRPITRYLSTHSLLQYTVRKTKLEDLLCHT
ncbi:hypothetical protein Q7W06_01390, partial [Streptococcus suis]|nr:hypothetical protein [Streptococcus suis]